MVTFSFIQRVLSSCYLYLRLVALGIFLCYTTACSTIAKYGMDSRSQELEEISIKPVATPFVNVPPFIIELYNLMDQFDAKGFIDLFSKIKDRDETKVWINKEWTDDRNPNKKNQRFPLLHTAILYLHFSINDREKDQFSNLCDIIQELILCPSVDLNTFYCDETPLQHLVCIGPGLDQERKLKLFKSFLDRWNRNNARKFDHVCDLVATSFSHGRSSREEIAPLRWLLIAEKLISSEDNSKIFKWGVENNYPAVVQAVLKHHLSDVCSGAESDYLKRVMHLAFDKCKDKPAKCNEAKMVKVLLDSEIIPVNELDDKGWYPIWYHVLKASYAHIVPMVLNHPSVNVNVRCIDGKHALHYLLHQFTKYPIEQSIKLLGLFLDNNKVELDFSEYDSPLLLPLETLGEAGPRTVVFLLDHPEIHRFNLDQSTLTSALVKLVKCYGGEYGAYADVKACMLKLIEKGADINGEEDLESWFPPLHTAVVGKTKGSDDIPLQLVEDLLGMDGIQLNRQSCYGLTPLHIAVLSFNSGAVHAFLNHEGVDLDIENEYGHSAFDCALGNLKYNIHDDDLPNAIAIVKAFLATDRFVVENKQAIRDTLDALIDFKDRKATIDRIEELYHIPNTERLDASHSIPLY